MLTVCFTLTRSYPLVLWNTGVDLREEEVTQYAHGDYVKVEFESSDGILPAEWMWVKVDRCDEGRRLVFGWLDNEPLEDADSLRLGQELAVSYDKIRDHKKQWEFKKN